MKIFDYFVPVSIEGYIEENNQNGTYSFQMFEIMKTQVPKFRHKVVAIAGDCSLPGLGISNTDKELLLREISIVFNVAATVKFDEKLKYAVAINVQGVKEIMDMCRRMQNLKVRIREEKRSQMNFERL